MTDYDGTRTCCSGADICERCWGFISAAVHVIDEAIRDQFGYKYLLWVYSGRRGIHLWISDREAMRLTDDQRRALVNWLTVIQGGKEMQKKVNVRLGPQSALPPSVTYEPPPPTFVPSDSFDHIFRMALEKLRVVFSDLILDDQDCFAERDGWESLLQLIPDEKVARALRDSWDSNPSKNSGEKWADLRRQVRNLEKKTPRRVRSISNLATIEPLIGL